MRPEKPVGPWKHSLHLALEDLEVIPYPETYPPQECQVSRRLRRPRAMKRGVGGCSVSARSSVVASYVKPDNEFHRSNHTPPVHADTLDGDWILRRFTVVPAEEARAALGFTAENEAWRHSKTRTARSS